MAEAIQSRSWLKIALITVPAIVLAGSVSGWLSNSGYGNDWFAGLTKPLDLKLVSRMEFGSGAVAIRYSPRK